jgi:hypothetical protein
VCFYCMHGKDSLSCDSHGARQKKLTDGDTKFTARVLLCCAPYSNARQTFSKKQKKKLVHRIQGLRRRRRLVAAGYLGGGRPHIVAAPTSFARHGRPHVMAAHVHPRVVAIRVWCRERREGVAEMKRQERVPPGALSGRWEHRAQAASAATRSCAGRGGGRGTQTHQ